MSSRTAASTRATPSRWGTWFDALVGRLAGVDVTDVLLYLPAILVPLALLLAYAAGNVVFRSPYGGVALAAVQVANVGLARRGDNLAGTGFFEHHDPAAGGQPSAPPSRGRRARLRVPPRRWRHRPCLPRRGEHEPDARPPVVHAVRRHAVPRFPARTARARTRVGASAHAGDDCRRHRSTAPLVLFLVLFYPVIRSSSSVTPSTLLRDHELADYGSFVTKLGPWFGMSPEAIARAGPVVVAGLIAIPLAAFAARRLWAALVLSWAARGGPRRRARAAFLHDSRGCLLALAGMPAA